MASKKLKVAVVGATGYTGLVLIELLLGHEHVTIQSLISENYAGRKFSDVYPAFTGLIDHTCAKPSLKLLEKAELVFFATPNGIAHKLAPALIKAGIKVIDLSADYRLRNLKSYEKAYGFKRKDINLNAKSIYALAEFKRAAIAKSPGVIANPGCYTTASILALTPLLQAHKQGKIKVNLDSIIIDAKSGTSGAGRKAATEQLYTELNENIAAYKAAGQHRHIPELEAFWSGLMKREVTVSFTPHLVPMTRGLLATCYIRLNSKTSIESLRKIYTQAYAKEPFVELLAAGIQPQTKWVVGTNRALIQIELDKRNNQITVTSVIDNLIKGAAGQALQNMNIIMGYPETTGLNLAPQLP
jgi:N-acetyl-gamma-glutamyl-phosphate reductase